MAVDDLSAFDLRTVRPAARAADDDVGLDPQARERGREERQRQRGGVVRSGATRLIGSVRTSSVGELGKRPVWLVERRVHRRIRERPRQRQHDALGAAALGQVVVNKRRSSIDAATLG